MSNDNREYPAWLDEELFSGLTGRGQAQKEKGRREEARG